MPAMNRDGAAGTQLADAPHAAGAASGGHRVPLIHLEGVAKTYAIGRAAVAALRDIDLTILPGEYVAIMGPSGSGKSTLMNIVGCLDSPSEGRYWFDGTDVSQMDDDRLSRMRNREIGFVFQTFNLLPRATALHNVELPLIYAGVPPRDRADRAAEALARVELAARARHKPNELSGGERQRVAIARALVTHPDLLLADEPTGNLDSRTGMEIMQLFRAIRAQGTTIILVTHEEDIGREADRTLRLRDGRIVADERRAGA
jgi:putative ABC transport system ATP-binding protein